MEEFINNIDWSQYFNIGNLITFIIGIIFGMAIAGIFYMMIILRSIRATASIRLPKETENKDVEDFIMKARKKYRENKGRKSSEERFILTKDIAVELAYEIAHYHFPESKNPYLEISAYEVLETLKYIVERVENILDIRPLRRLKNLSGIQVLRMFEWKDIVKDNKVVKQLVRFNNSKTVKAAKGIYSAISPTYFIRRTLMNTTVMFSVDALNQVFLNIVGEEVYRLYSKELFRMKDTQQLLEEGTTTDEEEA